MMAGPDLVAFAPRRESCLGLGPLRGAEFRGDLVAA